LGDRPDDLSDDPLLRSLGADRGGDVPDDPAVLHPSDADLGAAQVDAYDCLSGHGVHASALFFLRLIVALAMSGRDQNPILRI
jgi:hypothetical protein